MMDNSFVVEAGRGIVRSLKNIPEELFRGFTVFAIANTVFLAAFLTTNSLFFGASAFVEPDLVLLSLFTVYIEALVGSNFLFFVLGWVVAGFFARVKYPESGYKPILYGCLFLPLYTLFLVLYFSVMVISSTLNVLDAALSTSLTVILGTLLIVALIYGLQLVVAFPALLLIGLTKSSAKSAESTVTLMPNYLGLEYPKNNNETSRVCPFKDRSINGCSFLGYRSSGTSLICDQAETFRRCKLYSHLYSKRLEVIETYADE